MRSIGFGISSRGSLPGFSSSFTMSASVISPIPSSSAIFALSFMRYSMLFLAFFPLPAKLSLLFLELFPASSNSIPAPSPNAFISAAPNAEFLFFTTKSFFFFFLSGFVFCAFFLCSIFFAASVCISFNSSCDMPSFSRSASAASYDSG